MKSSRLVIIALWASYINTVWQLPNPNMRYDQVTFLASHNSFSALKYGYLIPQQIGTITQQLQQGVRALMLDIYLDKGFLGTKDERIALCHGNCQVTRYLLTAPGAGIKTLAEALSEVKAFLNANPREIVTIFLEDYVKDRKKLDNVIDEVGLGSMILKPSDWNPVERGSWPTLGQMQQQNKRLLFFSDKRKSASISDEILSASSTPLQDSSYAYYMWSNIKESGFSTLKKEDIAVERRQSKNQATSVSNREGLRFLYLLNFFPNFILPTKKSDISWNEIKNRTIYSITNNRLLRETLAYVLNENNGRYPNFIGVDFVNWGNPLDLVNEINAAAAGTSIQERNTMFAPLRIEAE